MWLPSTTVIQNGGFLHREIEGRDGEWDEGLGLGNPAADKSVNNYLRVVSAEQLLARVIPKQATPFFVDKLTMLSLHLQRELEKSTSAIQRFTITRDQAYFKTAVAIDQVKSYVFQITTVFCLIMFGGNPCERGTRIILESDETHKQPSVPLKESSNTWMWSDKSKLTLHVAYPFRPTTPNGGIQD